MSYSKTKIYNLALSALLLARQVSDVDTDNTTNEIRVLNTHWDIALESTLEDLDLDSLSQPVPLELIATLDEGPWRFVYKYPSRCAFLRRIESCAIIDTNRTHIAKRTGIYNGQKAIYTNEEKAVAECITKDVPLNALSPMAGMSVAYMLASLAAPLITGKGAAALRNTIMQSYQFAKNQAQEMDRRENFNYDAPHLRSEFVAARLE